MKCVPGPRGGTLSWYSSYSFPNKSSRIFSSIGILKITKAMYIKANQTKVISQLSVNKAIGIVWYSIPVYIGCLQKENTPFVTNLCSSNASGYGLHDVPKLKWTIINQIKLIAFRTIPIHLKTVYRLAEDKNEDTNVQSKKSNPAKTLTSTNIPINKRRYPHSVHLEYPTNLSYFSLSTLCFLKYKIIAWIHETTRIPIQ